MSPRSTFTLCFASLLLLALSAVALAVWLVLRRLPADFAANVAEIIMVYGASVAFALAACVAIVWAYLDRAMAQPIETIVKGIQTVLRANPEHRIHLEFSQLGGLPDAINDLVRQLALARANVRQEIEQATAKIEQQKAQLATILQDLHEGVIVCNLKHHILLYNTRALDLLRIGGAVGLDRSLLQFMSRQPILHALIRLTNRHAKPPHASVAGGQAIPFVGSTPDGKHTFVGRMSLILDSDGRPSGYSVSFEDKTEELATLGLRDRLLREATEGLRGPVGNLRAAAEILAGSPVLTLSEQAQFKQVLLQESQHVCDRLETLSAQYRDVITGQWPTSDIYSSNLFQALADRLREQRGIIATIIGLPHWLHGDSYTLVELLDRICRRVAAHQNVRAFDVGAAVGDTWIYVDVAWKGGVIAASALDGWLDEQIGDVLGGLSLREILERHNSDIWSQPHRDGMSRLRLPLPPATKPVDSRADPGLPARPEFYDFDLLARPAELGDFGQRSLRSLTYVVFDTETTGLDPAGGDEVVSIAGVRIVNGRILTGESFDRLVNPRRRIPAESIRFHGISDEAVADKPPIQLVLPQFRAFVGDAVLVAHNAAFDLKFLRLREAECRLRFDGPVLDTLLLSCYVHDFSPHHTLDAMAERFGVPIQGRHTALGDAIVTAGCFLRMLDLLEAENIVTLDQALDVSQSVFNERLRRARWR